MERCKNPNEDWWDEAIYDVGDIAKGIASQKGVKYYG